MDILRLKKSKTRETILRFFFSDVDGKYYLRDLERILDISVGNIRRELLSLEKTGLFGKEKAGNQVYYFLNRKSPIFEEVKKIVSKTIGIESILKEGLLRLKDVEIAFIYGSMAKGKEDHLSDIDVFILGNVDEDELNKFLNIAQKRLSREINYTLFSIKEFNKEIKDDIFLQDVISGKKIFLINTGNEFKKIIK